MPAASRWDGSQADDQLAHIRNQNLGAYEKMPSRVDEDVTQESQISADYRGRLTFELLQNADDAMIDGGFAERIVFRLTDDALEVGNSGRALTAEDIAGLCGTGASSKVGRPEWRRASIGHKGMGFKSVLEISDRPEVMSETAGFRLDASRSLPIINEALDGVGADPRRRAPVMRLPWPLETELAGWPAAQEAGLRVLFRFPYRTSLSLEQRDLLARRLLDLPVTAILFLKHLDDVEVNVQTSTVSGHFRWRLRREQRQGQGWVKVPGFGDSGVYRVQITGDDGTDLTFLVAHDADVEIGAHRSGLDGTAWDDTDLAEISLAVPWPTGTALRADWAKFHVFLPTEEASPYPMLVNGAFRTDLSRQEIRVGADALDYNRHLLREAAALFRNRLLPALVEEGVGAVDILGLLDRTRADGSRSPEGAAAVLHESLRDALADVLFIPGEAGLMLSLAELVVPPPTANGGTGRAFRDLLPGDAAFDDRWFPSSALCDAATATILADLGARTLGIRDAASVLAQSDPERSRLRPHAILGERLLTDPVLVVLGQLWAESRGRDRTELERSVRENPLFPVADVPESGPRRVRSDGLQCFYPPRGLIGEVPLRGLEFMLQQVCWGNLAPRERNEFLHDEMAAWQALFGIREFKFPDVMRASVFPALELDRAPEADSLRVSLQDMNRIAAICQLAGRSAKAANPLPHERLESNRTLFNLSRLRVPCRLRPNGIERWEPAYLVYFGTDWIGEASVEHVIDAARATGAQTPDVPFLAAPEAFLGRLERYQHLTRVADDDDSMEVSEDEDEEEALESNERDRWVNFLTWLGVNRVLRPVSFHDVMDAGAGWLSTSGLSKPRGWAFEGLGELWDQYADRVRTQLGDEGGTATRYFYGLHDLDHAGPILSAAHDDASGAVAQTLFGHLAHGWPQLSAFTRLAVAMSSDRSISKRTPPKPNDDELRFPTENFWLHRLRSAGWVPSTHGPRVAGRVWAPSAEIDRRFGRSGAEAGALIPILELADGVPSGRADALAQHLGIRTELSPAAFRESDARDLLTRIESRFAPAAEAGTLDERTLREVVRPAYRNLLELMTGPSGDDEDSDLSLVGDSLGDAPILVHDGAGLFTFVPGRDALYVSRAGTRERLGQPNIKTFVLETSVTARRPLRQLGIRTLEQVLAWVPDPGVNPLDEDQLNAFRSGLAGLAPFVLARLRAERADDRTAARDGARLRTLLSRIEPVDTLSLDCQLDGRSILSSDARDAHVGELDDGSLVAYVRWGERGWPPSRSEANALATVLVDALGGGAFETYVALVSADGDEDRFRLLRYAGAPTDLEEFRDLLFGAPASADGPPPVVPLDDLRSTSDEGEDWLRAAAGSADDGQRAASGRVPIYRADQLLIDGLPVIVSGDGAPGGQSGDPTKAGNSSGHGTASGYGATATDLEELNRVGMTVAVSFERHRLHLAGHPKAGIFAAGTPTEHAYVFDVSTPDAIKIAARESARFQAAHARLMHAGLSATYPGFDILSLDPVDEASDRLIELKSSGVDAQVQAMTWNEWKTARESKLRSRFYLYLVSNLRSDLGDRTPYLRAIQDPFGSLWRSEIVESGVRRSVQLNVRQFAFAEELPLQVRDRGHSV